MIHFAYPWLLWLLSAIPLFSIWYVFENMKQQAALLTSSIALWRYTPRSSRVGWRHSLFVLRMIAFAALVITIARPQKTLSKQSIRTEGVDIMLAFDISGSMLTRDFVPNRLDAAKKVAQEFIDARPNDRIGVVFFAAEAYTGCPITIDHQALKNIIENVRAGSLENGTAIGMGLGVAINRLKDNPSASKIIILMTDGENNAGVVKPLEAAQLARSMNIHLYCIGILSPASESENQTANVNITLKTPSAESTLLQMAEVAGGKYFRATNEKKLAGIYEEINQLEKTKKDSQVYTRYEERFSVFAIIAAFALLLEVIFRYTIFRKIP